jgi:hypothetical protein
MTMRVKKFDEELMLALGRLGFNVDDKWETAELCGEWSEHVQLNMMWPEDSNNLLLIVTLPFGDEIACSVKPRTILRIIEEQDKQRAAEDDDEEDAT